MVRSGLGAANRQGYGEGVCGELLIFDTNQEFATHTFREDDGWAYIPNLWRKPNSGSLFERQK